MKRSGLNCLVCIIAILLIRVSAVNAAERAQVQAVRLAEQGDATRIELRLSRSADFKMFMLTRPDRVVLDISAAA
ncbi:MAG: AMIN domain-containing protein, partial [Gammaproteobacteria bacterium]|nr:AMIN domain-containing protein [Gammaproteobacteria bacterium]